MKKIYQIIMLCAMAIAMVSCGGTKSDSEERESYHDSVAVACNNFDFAKAYLYAEKCDAKDEVIKKEGAYVLEQQGESGLVRISMIVNEHNAPWLYLDMLKMAISMGQESLATRLYKMSDACDEQAMDYAVTADMEGLVKTFVSKNSNFIDKQNVIEYLKEKGTYDRVFTVIEKQRQEEKKRAKEEAKAKILAELLASKHSLPECSLPSGLHLCTEDVSYDGGRELERKYQKYINDAHYHNNRCTEALIKAIEFGDKDFALSVMKYYVKNMHAVATGKRKWASEYGYASYYRISWDYKDKEEALTILRNAIQKKKIK